VTNPQHAKIQAKKKQPPRSKPPDARKNLQKARRDPGSVGFEKERTANGRGKKSRGGKGRLSKDEQTAATWYGEGEGSERN